MHFSLAGQNAPQAFKLGLRYSGACQHPANFAIFSPMRPVQTLYAMPDPMPILVDKTVVVSTFNGFDRFVKKSGVF